MVPALHNRQSAQPCERKLTIGLAVDQVHPQLVSKDLDRTLVGCFEQCDSIRLLSTNDITKHAQTPRTAIRNVVTHDFECHMTSARPRVSGISKHPIVGPRVGKASNDAYDTTTQYLISVISHRQLTPLHTRTAAVSHLVSCLLALRPFGAAQVSLGCHTTIRRIFR